MKYRFQQLVTRNNGSGTRSEVPGSNTGRDTDRTFYYFARFPYHVAQYPKSGLYRLIIEVARPHTINPLTPNDHYSGRTASLTSKRCILYIYSTNIGTEYFKHGIYSPFFPLQNAVCFIILTYLGHVLFIFYIQCVLKLKKNNSGAKRLRHTC